MGKSKSSTSQHKGVVMKKTFLAKIIKLQTQYGDFMNEHLTPYDIEYMAKILIKAHREGQFKRIKCSAMLASWKHISKKCTYVAVKDGLCTRHYKARIKE